MSSYEVMVWGGVSYVTGENFVIYVDSLFPLSPSPNYQWISKGDKDEIDPLWTSITGIETCIPVSKGRK